MRHNEHTPGPWRISVESSMIIESNIGQIVGSASTYPNSGYFPNENEAKANARLIAAAPELLEALLLFVTLYGTDDVTAWQYIRDKAVSAIAKAKGEQP